MSIFHVCKGHTHISLTFTIWLYIIPVLYLIFYVETFVVISFYLLFNFRYTGPWGHLLYIQLLATLSFKLEKNKNKVNESLSMLKNYIRDLTTAKKMCHFM